MSEIASQIATPKNWHKSTYSQADTNCVEVAYVASGGAAVRDTQYRMIGHLTFDNGAWSAFLKGVKGSAL
ncbi:uncharacterized protein DUF397 [Murinocardiopsis flavida]|uniref:Uncharacterized protein DUF397 n=1 Tax=Murinocardiopsis flavida TaxID=645275 RepID=A0A2P8DL51_9ACTN|nr:DUF397 domain-containing protein [Murinocardiopsis flavida]PSK97957.1 uncharacterized protein DUF397 [Murinocardiopsis flavida]